MVFRRLRRVVNSYQRGNRNSTCLGWSPGVSPSNRRPRVVCRRVRLENPSLGRHSRRHLPELLRQQDHGLVGYFFLCPRRWAWQRNLVLRSCILERNIRGRRQLNHLKLDNRGRRKLYDLKRDICRRKHYAHQLHQICRGAGSVWILYFPPRPSSEQRECGQPHCELHRLLRQKRQQLGLGKKHRLRKHDLQQRDLWRWQIRLLVLSEQIKRIHLLRHWFQWFELHWLGYGWQLERYSFIKYWRFQSNPYEHQSSKHDNLGRNLSRRANCKTINQCKQH